MDIRQFVHNLFLATLLLYIHHGLVSVEGGSIEDEDYEDGPTFGRCPWIRNKLKNGRVRYRYKGRVAKFLCDSGYELAGKRSSTCVRGQWSNPVPFCVARGCSRVPSIPNGRVTEMYRGALLVYDCNPGYQLDGDTSIHCDGRRWSTAPPTCVIATENPEISCDFESPDLCGWSHDPNHDFDWKRHQFTTPSGHVGTGPSFDHTYGENKGGYYLYIEASSPRKINDTARLFSPVYPSDISGGCFVFWYHMYGATTGGLRVYLKPESHVFDELRPNWEKFGDQGNQWLRGNIIVPVLHENFQIVIEGIRGESYVGDSAIDDVRLTTNLCENLDNSTESTQSTAQDSCRGRCREADTGSSCSCNDNCFVASSCCRDYLTICGAGNDTSVQNTDEPLPGDYFGKTSSLITVTVSQTSLKITEEQPETITTSSSSVSSVTATSPTVSSSTARSSSTISITSSTPSSSTSNTPITATSTKLSTTSTTTTKPPTTTKKPTTVQTTSSTSTPKAPTTETLTQSTKTNKPTTTTVSTVKETSSTIPATTLKTTESSTSTKETTLTTQSTQSTQPTTVPPTTTLSSTHVSSSTFSSSTKISSTQPSTAETVPLVSTPTSTQSSTLPPSSTITTESSTRKTYNLRPRTQRTTPVSSTTSTSSSVVSTIKQTVSRNTPVTESVSTTTEIKTTFPHTTAWYRFTVSSSVASTRATTISTISTRTTVAPTTGLTKPRYIPQTSTQNVPKTTKFFNRITKPTESSIITTTDLYQSRATKSEANTGNGSIPIVIIVVVIIIIFVAAVVYYIRKQRNKRQSKLSDDSEMRFLPESEYMEYSDASALDKILVK